MVKRTRKKNSRKKISKKRVVFNPYQQSIYSQTNPMPPQQFVQQSQIPQSIQNISDSPTGITEFDNLIGGGFPTGSVILLSGSSGSGKTIFSFQWLFEGVKNNENGLYITLTEPLFKTIKNLEEMAFYDRAAIEQERLKIVDIREICEKKFDYERILNFIEEQVRQTNAKRLCIDSITAIAYNLDDKAKIRKFIFELGKILATLGCTTILTSEVSEAKKYSVYGVEEFISDAILRLDQIKIRGELQRVMQIIKIRGKQYTTEDLYFKISENGITVFPKVRVPLKYSSTTERISIGNEILDKMLYGGVFKGSSTLIAGSTGTGKSLLSMQFIVDGLRKGESCLYAGFEESREQLIRNARCFGWDLEKYEKEGTLVLRCFYPGEKFLEEHLADIKEIVESKKINRCVIDSLSSIANFFPDGFFINFTKRLNSYLKTKDVTTLLTSATGFLVGGTKLTENNISTLVDNIIMLRYVEIEGELKLVLNIVKVRGSNHSKELRRYEITNNGIVIGQSLVGYEGIMTGVTRKVSETVEEKLNAEFKKFIGPMASSVFSEIKDKGLTKTNIFHYIDDLAKSGIMKEEDANKFKQNIEAIINKSIDEDNADKQKGLDRENGKSKEE